MIVAVGAGAVGAATAVGTAAEEVAGIVVAVGTAAGAGRQGAAGQWLMRNSILQMFLTSLFRSTTTMKFLLRIRDICWHSADLDGVTAAAAAVLVTEAVAAGVVAVVGDAAAAVPDVDVVYLEIVCTMSRHVCLQLLRIESSAAHEKARWSCRAWIRGAPGPAEPRAGSA